MRKVLAILFLFAMMFSSGCGLLVLGDWNFMTYSGSWEQEYDFSGKEVSIEGFNGSITVNVWEESRVSVAAKWSAKVENYQFNPIIELDENRLYVGSPRNDRDLGGVRYVVSVPEGMTVKLHTSNGGVSVTGGVLDELDISTSNGSALVDCAGTGQLTINTSNSPARISGWLGEISCTTSNGAITAIVDKLEDGEYTFTTSNGGISVSVDADSKFDIQAYTSNGSVRTSLEAEWKPELKTSESSYQGRYNGGGAYVTARTSNANIQLLPSN